nr:unnamed protein product [Callosobruchus chinensis]
MQDIGTLHPMAIGHILQKKLKIPNIVRIHVLGQLSNSDLAPLSSRHNTYNRANRMTTSQPSVNITQTQPNIPLSQPELPNKKRKANSPTTVSTIEPMFPFLFGPKQPLPQNQKTQNDESHIVMIFHVLQQILSEANSFEDLAKVDIECMRNLIIRDYSKIKK